MTTRFRFTPREGAPVDPRQDILVDGGVRIGRAPHCEIRLLRQGVAYEHATLRHAGGMLVIEAAAGASLGPAAGPAGRVELAPGDTARIGPYELGRAPDDPGGPIVIVTPKAAAADESAVAAYYRSAFDVRLPNVRFLGFALSCAVALLFLFLPLTFGSGAPGRSGPLAAQPGDRTLADTRPVVGQTSVLGALWTVGNISDAHRAFGDECIFCHLHPFSHVPSDACLGCHRDTAQHADPVRAPIADLSKQRCENCHREHKGPRLATRDGQSDCVSCHADIKTVEPDSTLRPVHDFGSDHPQLAATLVQDAVLRADVGGADPPGEFGLRFTHAKHLALDRLNKAGGAACALCHKPELGGVTFKPVAFDAACAGCHTLQFEPLHPEWRLPHGHPEEVASRIAGYYARAALAGETFAAPSSDLFAKPGAALPPPSPRGAAMVTAQTAAAMMSSIARSACGQCHNVTQPMPGDPPERFKVDRIDVPERFFLRATFSHASHATTPCAACHDARGSNAGALALLPGIETCRQCHAGEAGAVHRIASPCVSCHVFHDKTLPAVAMRPHVIADTIVGTSNLKTEAK